MRLTLPAQAAMASFIPVDLDEAEASHIVRNLAQRPDSADITLRHLLVDCGRLRCLRHLGVSYVVSQLLVLHQSGARVFLCNVDPLLQRCLRLLRLDTLFPLV